MPGITELSTVEWQSAHVIPTETSCPFSTFPLKVVAYAGLVVSAFSLLLVFYALFGRFVTGRTPEGWTSVFVSLAFFSGVQLVATGVLGMYLSRIFEEVKGRPVYVVASDTAAPPAPPTRSGP